MSGFRRKWGYFYIGRGVWMNYDLQISFGLRPRKWAKEGEEAWHWVGDLFWSWPRGSFRHNKD